MSRSTLRRGVQGLPWPPSVGDGPRPEVWNELSRSERPAVEINHELVIISAHDP